MQPQEPKTTFTIHVQRKGLQRGGINHLYVVYDTVYGLRAHHWARKLFRNSVLCHVPASWPEYERAVLALGAKYQLNHTAGLSPDNRPDFVAVIPFTVLGPEVTSTRSKTRDSDYLRSTVSFAFLENCKLPDKRSTDVVQKMVEAFGRVQFDGEFLDLPPCVLCHRQFQNLAGECTIGKRHFVDSTRHCFFMLSRERTSDIRRTVARFTEQLHPCSLKTP